MLDSSQVAESYSIEFGNTTIDGVLRSVFANKQREYLAPQEYTIFTTMIKLNGQPLLVDHLADTYPQLDKRGIACLLSRIRKKLELIQSNITIRAVRDAGYCLVVDG